MSPNTASPAVIRVVAIVVLVFGAMTLIPGGGVLIGPPEMLVEAVFALPVLNGRAFDMRIRTVPAARAGRRG